MKAVVIGSSGTIGKAVSELLKAKGFEVLDSSRSTSPAIDITDPLSIDKFYKQADEVDVIICAAGDAAFSSLDKLTDAQVQLSLNSKLLGQINVVRKGISNLKPGGVFVLTGGILAYTPGPQTSMIAMVNAGLEGFVKGAAFDLPKGKRIVIVHPPWIAETAAKFGMDPSPWPSAAKAAEAYLKAAKGTMNGKAVFVDGYEPRVS